MTWWIVVLVLGCVGLGLVIGTLGGGRRLQKGVNVALATMAVTGYVTYGEEWTKDFMAEMNQVTHEPKEKLMILALAREMDRVQNRKGG